MPRDYIDDDSSQSEKSERLSETNEVAARSHPRQSNSSLSNLKDYIIVALIAIVVFIGFNNYIFARTNNGGGGSVGGCCSSGGGAAAVSTDELRQIGLEYYVATYGDTEVEAVVQDFGCHQEIHIYKEGQLIQRIGYGNGQVYEIAL
jgi:hypothetical protein